MKMEMEMLIGKGRENKPEEKQQIALERTENKTLKIILMTVLSNKKK